MPLLIDTYNLLHVTGVLPPHLAGLDLGGLIDLIRQSRYARQTTYLICDGSPTGAAHGHDDGAIHVRYAGPGRLADDLIARIIGESSAPKRLLVVSSDRAVQRTARRRRCPVLSSPQFLRHLAADDARPAPAPLRPADAVTAELDEWIETFELTPDDLELPAAPPPAPVPSAPDPAPVVEPEPAPPAPPEPASPPPRERLLPPDILREAREMEAAWAIEAAPSAAGPDATPDQDQPDAAREAPTATSDDEAAPASESDEGPVLPPSVLEEAEALLRRAQPRDEDDDV